MVRVAAGTVAVASTAMSATPAASWWWPLDRSHPVLLVGSGVAFSGQANLGTSNGVAAIVGDTDWGPLDISTPSAVYGSYEVLTVVNTTASPTNAGGTLCLVGDASTNRCSQFRVTYYPYYVGSTTRGDDNFWRVLGCHELVHTVGVAERSNNDCVNSGWAIANRSAYDARHPTYSVGEINNIYKNTVA